jgi:plastocyanin
MHRVSPLLSETRLLTVWIFLSLAGLFFAPAVFAVALPLHPVYIHMNGENVFLESVVAVYPGQPVVFVNEDTGLHMVQGYNPLTGKPDPRFTGVLDGTPGPSHPVHTLTFRFRHSGFDFYYCPVHAELVRGPGGVYVPIKRPTVGGFGTPMAGVIIVTTDPALVRTDPPTSREKILPGFFGGGG